jgi:GNAT superfamily N-acetyltransferase
MIADGYHDLPPGKLANLVTFLEMHARPSERFEERDDATIAAVRPDVDAYRNMFRRIGAPYLWSSRLTLSDRSLQAILDDPDVENYELRRNGSPDGMLELDFREPGSCEVAFFGLVREAQGRGLGRYLMRFALQRAWERSIRRVWLHTCTLDHPGAIAFYRKCGFEPYKRQFEISDDPRAAGLLPLDAAPHIPLL